MIVLKEFVSLTMFAMETERYFFRHHINNCNEEKMLHQKHESYKFKSPLKN